MDNTDAQWTGFSTYSKEVHSWIPGQLFSSWLYTVGFLGTPVCPHSPKFILKWTDNSKLSLVVDMSRLQQTMSPWVQSLLDNRLMDTDIYTKYTYGHIQIAYRLSQSLSYSTLALKISTM